MDTSGELVGRDCARGNARAARRMGAETSLAMQRKRESATLASDPSAVVGGILWKKLGPTSDPLVLRWYPQCDKRNAHTADRTTVKMSPTVLPRRVSLGGMHIRVVSSRPKASAMVFLHGEKTSPSGILRRLRGPWGFTIQDSLDIPPLDDSRTRR